MTNKLQSTFKKYIKHIVSADSPPRRSIEVFDDDVFLVSYPRSGNTWVRFLLANLLKPEEEINFNNLGLIIPDIYFDTNREISQISKPRILKSHEYLDIRYKKVIYIVRDPRDVMVSYYQFKTLTNKIDRNYSLDLFAKQFLRGEIDSYGSWGEHVGGWIGARGERGDFLLLRFEDILQDPVCELKKIDELLSLNSSKDYIRKAVCASSIDAMKRLEITSGGKWETLKSSWNDDTSFIRRGCSGQWKEYLSDSIEELVTKEFHKLMSTLGYC